MTANHHLESSTSLPPPPQPTLLTRVHSNQWSMIVLPLPRQSIPEVADGSLEARPGNGGVVDRQMLVRRALVLGPGRGYAVSVGGSGLGKVGKVCLPESGHGVVIFGDRV